MYLKESEEIVAQEETLAALCQGRTLIKKNHSKVICKKKLPRKVFVNSRKTTAMEFLCSKIAILLIEDSGSGVFY